MYQRSGLSLSSLIHHTWAYDTVSGHGLTHVVATLQSSADDVQRFHSAVKCTAKYRNTLR